VLPRVLYKSPAFTAQVVQQLAKADLLLKACGINQKTAKHTDWCFS
jgi:hypothetical protein